MNKTQFKRLLLVLILPLFALGWWTAESEIWFPQQHLTECEEFEESFSCVTISITQKSLDEYRFTSGGVFLPNGGRLSHGFNAPVITTGGMEFNNGVFREKTNADAGIRKQLAIGKSAGAGGGGYCRLSPYSNSTTQWSISCLHGSAQDFKFVDEKTNEKYFALIKIVNDQVEKARAISRNAYFLTLTSPLIIFLTVSAALYFLTLAFSYIKYGKAGAPQSENSTLS